MTSELFHATSMARKGLFDPNNQASNVNENHITQNVVFRVTPKSQVHTLKVQVAHLKASLYRRLSSMGKLRLKDPIKRIHKSVNMEKLAPYFGQLTEDQVLAMEPVTIQQMIIRTREDSMALQALLVFCSEKVISYVLDSVERVLPSLVIHELAVYVLARLIARSDEAVKSISREVLSSFQEYCQNEHSSRVMQALCEQSIAFRTETVRRYLSAWSQSISSISGVFLLTACIREAESPSEFEDIKVRLLQDKEIIPFSKSHKRLVLVLTENCKDEDLQLLADLLCSKQYLFVSLIDDKYLVFALLNLIRRGVTSVLQVLAEWIKSKPSKLLQAKYGQLLLYKLTTMGASETISLVVAPILLAEAQKRHKGQRKTKLSEGEFMFMVWLILTDQATLGSDKLEAIMQVAIPIFSL